MGNHLHQYSNLIYHRPRYLTRLILQTTHSTITVICNYYMLKKIFTGLLNNHATDERLINEW